MTDVQEKWLQILETTDRPQHRVRLALGEARCCLGLACDLYIESHDDLIQIDDEYLNPKTLEYNNFLPPKQVWEWLGLKTCLGGIYTHTSTGSIVNLNSRHSFKEIAAIIRADPEAYFVHQATN